MAPTTRIAIPTEPWERAKATFLEGLTEKERQLYETASLETIFYQADVAHEEYRQSSKLQAARSRLAPFVNAVDGWGKGIDVVAGQSAGSLFLAPIWGCCRVVIYMAQEFDNYFQKLINMFGKIGNALPQFRDYERIYPNHERLLLALSDSYLNIVEFCDEVKRAFKQPAFAKASRASVLKISAKMSLKTQWKPFVERLNDHFKKFEEQTAYVEREASLAHMLEDKHEQEQQEESRALQRIRQRQKKLRECLARLSPIRYANQILRFQDIRHPGTGSWLFEEECFNSWINSPESSCFYCTGIPGCGKTILASTVFTKMSKDYALATDLAACYFCEYSESATLASGALLGVLIRQILDSRVHPPELSEWILDHCDNDQLLPTKKDLLEVIIRNMSSFKRVFLIFDGIDELGSTEQLEVYEIIRQLLHIDSCCIKVFVSCRRDAVPSTDLNISDRHLDVSLHHVGNDLGLFVADSVDEEIAKGRLTLRDPDLRQEIIDSLKRGAEDMFLWAKFQILEVCEADNDEAIRNVLLNLPKDIATTYDRILLRISSSMGGREKIRAAERVLKWVSFARRPLTIDELKEAVAVEEDDKRLHVERIASDGGTKLLRSCGNLVVLDERDKTVRLAHHTVRQYLYENWATTRIVSELFPNYERHDLSIGKLCIAYLHFSDFESQIVRTDKSRTVFETDSRSLHPILWTPFVGRALASALGFQASPNGSEKLRLFVPKFQNREKSSENDLRKQYHLLDYVVENWVFHLPRDEVLRGHEDLDFDRNVRILCFDKHFLFQIRPWESTAYTSCSDDRSPPKGYALFRWAFDHGIEYFFKAKFLPQIPSTYFEFETLDDNDTRNLLSRAAASGSLFMLINLLQLSYVHIHFVPLCMLYRAASVSSEVMLSSLIEQLYSFKMSIAFRDTPEDPRFWQTKAQYWHQRTWKDVVRPPNEDYIKDALLRRAVKAGNIPLAESLLKLGAHARRLWDANGIRTDDMSFHVESPFHHAVTGDHWDMAVLLSEVSLRHAPFSDRDDGSIAFGDSMARNELVGGLTDSLRDEGITPGPRITRIPPSRRKALAAMLREHERKFVKEGEAKE